MRYMMGYDDDITYYTGTLYTLSSVSTPKYNAPGTTQLGNCCMYPVVALISS